MDTMLKEPLKIETTPPDAFDNSKAALIRQLYLFLKICRVAISFNWSETANEAFRCTTKASSLCDLNSFKLPQIIPGNTQDEEHVSAMIFNALPRDVSLLILHIMPPGWG